VQLGESPPRFAQSLDAGGAAKAELQRNSKQGVRFLLPFESSGDGLLFLINSFGEQEGVA
jgi:hypothetical protein